MKNREFNEHITKFSNDEIIKIFGPQRANILEDSYVRLKKMYAKLHLENKILQEAIMGKL